LAEVLADAEFREHPASCFFFGVGDHGGGPTRREIAMVDAYLCEHPDVTASYSSCEAFFDDAAARTQAIPVYCGDLHMHAVGCYSVVRPLKQAVRKNEHGLGFTERCLRLAGDPRPDLSNLWKTVLFNEFHDILPGSCTADAARQALAELGGVEHSWRDLAYDALRRISSGMPVRCRQGEFRVFNSLPWPITVPIQIESFQYYREGAVFRDRAGQQIPIQESLAGARAFTRRWEFVDTVPAASARSYWFDDSSRREGDLDHRPHFVPGEEVATDTAGVSAGGGLWTRLDRGDSRCSWAPLEFAVLADESDTWGHRVRTYNDQVGVFERVLSSVQRGPVASRLRHRWEFGRSSIEAVYTVYTGLPGVRLDLTVNWHEFRRILKMRVRPEGAVADTLVMGGARGPIPRACDGLELPLHHWLVQECPSAQALLVQDGAFACDALAGTVSVTLVRSSVFAFHDPVKLDPQDPQDETDQGLHHFRFLFRGVDAHDPVEFDRAARTFVEPLWVVREGWSGTEGRD
jgi:alpha-mannosidase